MSSPYLQGDALQSAIGAGAARMKAEFGEAPSIAVVLGSGWASALAEGWGYLRRVAGFIEIALQIASCGEIEDLLGGLHDPLISSRELRRPESRVLEINAHRLGAEDLFVPVGKSAHRAP